MRSTVLLAVPFVLLMAQPVGAQPTAKDDKKDTAAAELTRTKALKAKVSVDYKDARLGDVLKEFAAQADMRADALVMWAYGPGFPYAQKVSYACKDKAIEVALDELLTKAGGGLGYLVVSKEDDRRDGWVLLNTTGERGSELPPASAEDEAAAAERLTLAKKLIDGGKGESARPVLTLVAKKYPNTKAAAEARQLLSKLDK
ncbi:MAG: tetratricopeptide repeat protein [Gemmata sp.]